MKFNDKPHSVQILFGLVLLCVFTLLSLSLVTIGKDVYSRIAVNLQQNNDLRMAVSYTSNKIRSYDYEGGVGIINDSGIDVLSLNEPDGVLSTYIYYYDGCLREYQIFEGEDFPPEKGEILVGLKSFNFNITEHSISFSLTENNGKSTDVTVYLRAA